MRKLPAYDPYLDTILCIRSAHHSPDEEAALIQNVFDALHLVQHRRPKKERDLHFLSEMRQSQPNFQFGKRHPSAISDGTAPRAAVLPSAALRVPFLPLLARLHADFQSARGRRSKARYRALLRRFEEGGSHA